MHMALPIAYYFCMKICRLDASSYRSNSHSNRHHFTKQTRPFANSKPVSRTQNDQGRPRIEFAVPGRQCTDESTRKYT